MHILNKSYNKTILEALIVLKSNWNQVRLSFGEEHFWKNLQLIFFRKSQYKSFNFRDNLPWKVKYEIIKKKLL